MLNKKGWLAVFAILLITNPTKYIFLYDKEVMYSMYWQILDKKLRKWECEDEMIFKYPLEP